MMNRIKHFALFALLLVPAMAQASARSFSDEMLAAGLVTPSRASAKAGDVKGNAEVVENRGLSSGGRYLRALEKDKAYLVKSFNKAATAKWGKLNKKKDESINSFSTFYKRYPGTVGALVGAALWGGIAVLGHKSDYREMSYANTLIPTAFGACCGAYAAKKEDLGYFAFMSGFTGTGNLAFSRPGSQCASGIGGAAFGAAVAFATGPGKSQPIKKKKEYSLTLAQQQSKDAAYADKAMNYAARLMK